MFTTFLNLLDGVDCPGNVVVVATTNDVSMLDPAVTRPGRLDTELVFEYLSAEDSAPLLRTFLSGIDLDFEKVAKAVRECKEQLVPADLESLSAKLLLAFGTQVTTEQAVDYIQRSWTASISRVSYL